MSDLTIALLCLIGVVQGFVIGWLIFASITPFKQGFIDGMTFHFWRKK